MKVNPNLKMFKTVRINQSITGCIIALGGFGFGCALSWTATALPSLEETGQIGELSVSEKSWIASLLTIGAFLACLIKGFLMNEMGRKSSLLCFSVIGLLGWLLLACGTQPMYIYFGRVLTGISVGGYTMIVPIYVSDIASKENRGLLGSLFLVMLCIGKLFSNGVGILFTASTASFLCALHPVTYAILLLIIPESPAVLVKKHKEKDAQFALIWLETRGFCMPYILSKKSSDGWQSSDEVMKKLENLKMSSSSDCSQQVKVTFREFMNSPELIRPTIIVLIQMFLSQACGINLSTFYTVEIFRMSGDMLIEAKLATVILAVIQTIGCLPCSVFVDKYGRKLLLMSSFLAMGVATGGFAVYFYMRDYHMDILEQHSSTGLVPLIALVVYNLAYSWGVGSIVWIVMSELLPPTIMGPASLLANIVFWGSAFSITQAFQMFKTDIALYMWFAAFSAFCVLGCIFNKIFLPETKGLTLQEIQLYFIKGLLPNDQPKEKIKHEPV